MSDEFVLNPEPRPCWLATTINGQPMTLEIVEIEGKKIESLAEAKERIRTDSVVIVDRGIVPIQMAAPGGMRLSLADVRSSLGAFYIPQDGDLSKPENRRPVMFRGSALFQGPYLWLDLTNPGEQEVLEMVNKLYSPPSNIQTPDKPALVAPGPGALQALSTFNPK